MSRKSAIRSIYVNFPYENAKCAQQRGKRAMIAKGRAAIAQKNAFLDLQQAMEKHRRAMELGTTPVDVTYYQERHAQASAEKIRIRKLLRP